MLPVGLTTACASLFSKVRGLHATQSESVHLVSLTLSSRRRARRRPAHYHRDLLSQRDTSSSAESDAHPNHVKAGRPPTRGSGRRIALPRPHSGSSNVSPSYPLQRPVDPILGRPTNSLGLYACNALAAQLGSRAYQEGTTVEEGRCRQNCYLTWARAYC